MQSPSLIAGLGMSITPMLFSFLPGPTREGCTEGPSKSFILGMWQVVGKDPAREQEGPDGTGWDRGVG